MPKESVAEVTALPELSTTSEAEQMYLITVARAVEAGTEGPVSIARIAGALQVSVPSANEMVRKLDSRGLLVYEPYHGAQLSAAGRALANQVLRTRRLWATFLAGHLGFDAAEADEQACSLEHATTGEAADRLAEYLGNPAAGPLGQPIPTKGLSVPPPAPVRLDDLPVGVLAEVVAVTAVGRSREFLRSENVIPGVTLTITAAGSSGLLVDLTDREVHLSNRLAASIDVRRVGGHRASA
ncbi:MAG: metal-dependent transcriptional regulator [Acidimicrobiia bacterium]